MSHATLILFEILMKTCQIDPYDIVKKKLLSAAVVWIHFIQASRCCSQIDFSGRTRAKEVKRRTTTACLKLHLSTVALSPKTNDISSVLDLRAAESDFEFADF